MISDYQNSIADVINISVQCLCTQILKWHDLRLPHGPWSGLTLALIGTSEILSGRGQTILRM